MSKVDYFRELNYRLRGLPERERHNILQVYEELFQKAVENGKREDEIAESLGYPRVPQWEEPAPAAPKQADQGYSQPFSPSYEQPRPRPEPAPYTHPYPVKGESGIKAILVSIALGFFNLIFVLGPFLGICGVIIGLYASSFALTVSPIALLIGNDWNAGSADVQFSVYAMLAFFGAGLLLSSLTIWFSKLFFKLTRMYVRFNMKLIKGA
ncbi:hypothetical protein D3C73_543190 [compost metagenome]